MPTTLHSCSDNCVELFTLLTFSCNKFSCFILQCYVAWLLFSCWIITWILLLCLAYLLVADFFFSIYLFYFILIIYFWAILSVLLFAYRHTGLSFVWLLNCFLLAVLFFLFCKLWDIFGYFGLLRSSILKLELLLSFSWATCNIVAVYIQVVTNFNGWIPEVIYPI